LLHGLIKDGPQPVHQVLPVGGKGVSENKDLVRGGVEEPGVKVLLLAEVARQEGEAGVELLTAFLLDLGIPVGVPKERVNPAAVRGHVPHDGRYFICVGIQESVP
jgi:hypothetical protein